MATVLDRALTRTVDRAPDIRRALLSALVVVIPIAFLRFTSDPFNIPKLVVLAAGVAAVLALRLLEVSHQRSWQGLTLLAIPSALLSVPLVLSWALSPYRGWALFGLQGRFQGLLPYFLVVIFGILIADAFRGHAHRLGYSLLWAGAIVGGYALVQTVGLDPFNWSLYGAPTEAVSTTGNPNFTGGFLGIVLPLGLGLILTDPERRRVTARLLVLTTLGWIVARSQGGWAAGIAGSAIVVGYHFRSRYRLAHVAGWATAALVAMVTISVVLVALVAPDSRVTTSAALVRARWSQAAFDMGLDHPLAGRGPNSFAIEGVRHRPIEDAIAFNYDFPDDPHSVPMSMLSNLGFLGLIGFLGILGWALWFFLRTPDRSLMQVGFIGAVVAYFVQSLVSIDEITLRIELWAALGGLVAASYIEEKKRVPSKGRSKKAPPKKTVTKASLPGVATAGAVLLAGVAWALSILAADVFARQGSQRFAAGDVAGGTAKYESALSLRDSADYRGRMAFGLKALAIDEQGVDEAALDAADETFSFTEEIPYVFSIVAHARLLEEIAQEKGVNSAEAATLYRNAMELDPRNPLIRVELAHVLLRGGQAEEALAALADIRGGIGQRVPEYWGALALSAARAGHLDDAREAAEIALSLSPAQPDATKATEIFDKGDT